MSLCSNVPQVAQPWARVRFAFKDLLFPLMIRTYAFPPPLRIYPDHGVPVTTREFLDFRKAVKTISDFTKSPVLVHCSAGVGRTGTYITVDRCAAATVAACESFTSWRKA